MISEPANAPQELANYYRLRQKVFLSVSLLIITIVILSIWNLRRNYHATIRDAEEQTQSRAHALKEHAERTFYEADQALQSAIHEVQSMGGVQAIDVNKTTRLLKNLGSNFSQIAAISIAGADGKLQASSLLAKEQLPDISKRPYFIYHRDNKSNAIHISPPIQSLATGKWGFILSRRIEDATGNFSGIAAAFFDISYFEKLYAGLATDRNARYSLATMSGDYLVLVPDPAQVYKTGKKTSAAMQARMAQASRQTYHTKSSNVFREPRITSYHRLDRYPVVAIMSFNKHHVLGEWRTLLMQTVLVTGGLLILLLFLTVLHLRQIKQLDLSNHQLLLQHEELRAAKTAAESAARVKSAFLANMSHELRTPLTAIIGFAQLVEETALTAQQAGYMNRLSNASQSLLTLINNILDHSKIEADGMSLEHARFSLDGVLNDTLNLFTPAVERKGIALQLERAPDLPAELIGDSLRLGQVLNNLVGNAVKFTDKGGITVRVDVAERHTSSIQLRFAIRDTGIGLTGEQRARLFKPFVQAESSIGRRFGGTGLGLSIARSLVTLMGGDISISSNDGQGSVFTFSAVFGLHESADSPPETDHNRLYDIAIPIQNARILVVEDSEATRFMTRALLEKAGLHTTCAQNGLEALDLLQTFSFDAILMDVSMPGMDGLEATGRIRKLAGCATIPIIAMTGAVMEGDRKVCLEAGMNDLLPKPVDSREMLELLVRWIRSSKGDGTDA